MRGITGTGAFAVGPRSELGAGIAVAVVFYRAADAIYHGLLSLMGRPQSCSDVAVVLGAELATVPLLQNLCAGWEIRRDFALPRFRRIAAHPVSHVGEGRHRRE